MSSFDAVELSTQPRDDSDGFEPLCPEVETAEVLEQSWRPLFAELEGDDAVGWRGRLAVEGHGEPQEQSESDLREDGVEAASEEREQAFSAGYERGVQDARADLQTVAECLVQSVEAVAAFRGRLRDHYEGKLLELALGVARKVLHAEVQERPDMWLAMIREAIREAVDCEEVRIRLPAALAAFFTEQLPELRGRLEEVKELVVVEDPSLREGACVIETRFGELDVGIDTQVDRIERELSRA